LFEYNETGGHWEAAHHMFSMPQSQYLDTLESDPGSVKGNESRKQAMQSMTTTSNNKIRCMRCSAEKSSIIPSYAWFA
ncbi:MAG: hypothetical protein PHS76_06390, partial [Sphaerochaeta sp.]|nr:hypothetical protein [Sphaerochaeta sp.]